MLRDESHYRPILRRLIHPDNLPKQFGGNNEKFDPHFQVEFVLFVSSCLQTAVFNMKCETEQPRA